MKIMVKLKDVLINREFDLAGDKGRDGLNRFISELYNMFYYFDDDDYDSSFVELKTQYPHVFKNFSNAYIGKEVFGQLGLHDIGQQRDYILVDQDLLVGGNIKSFIGEESELRTYIFKGDLGKLIKFKSKYIDLKFYQA